MSNKDKAPSEISSQIVEDQLFHKLEEGMPFVAYSPNLNAEQLDTKTKDGAVLALQCFQSQGFALTPLEEGQVEEYRLQKITKLFRQGTLPTVNNLVMANILHEDHELVQTYKAIVNSLPDDSLVVIDEMPFFIRFNNEGNIIRLNPVLHLQYIPLSKGTTQ